MSHGKEPSLRKLIDARENIIAQLDDLQWHPNSTRISRWGGSPDNRSVIAELEGQLNEIDALLGNEDEPNA